MPCSNFLAWLFSATLIIFTWLKKETNPKNRGDFKNEDNYKNEEDLRNDDDLRNENDLRNEDDLKIEDDLKCEDDLKIVKDHSALPYTAVAVIFISFSEVYWCLRCK